MEYGNEDACITEGSGWAIKGDNSKKKYIDSEDACITEGSGWTIKGDNNETNNKNN